MTFHRHRDEIGLQKGKFDDDLWADQTDYDQLEAIYKAHLIERTGWINEELERLHRAWPNQVPRLFADCSQALAAASYVVRNVYSVTAAMRDTGQGKVIYREGIKTCFELWEAIYLRGEDHVVAFGGTNLGKTSCSHFLRLITGPLNALIRNKMTCVLNVYIPRRTVIDNAELSFNSLIDLYGLIRITTQDGPKLSMGFKEYHDKVIRKLWHYAVEGKRKGDLNQSRTRKEIKKIIDHARKEGLDTLTLVDEIHYAPKQKGFLGRNIPAIDGTEDEDDASDENGIGAETLKVIGESAPCVCAFSATPDPNLQEPWTRCKMRYSAEYASTHLYFLGEKIADIQIPVWSFSKFREESGIDLSLVDSRQLNGRDRVSPRRVNQMYARVLEALNWLYSNRPDGRPYLGSLVRLEKSNENADKFADYIEKHSDIKVRRYYGSDNKDNPREQLTEYIEKGVKFCVVPTAACRMADDLPREVCYLLDFTYRTVYSTSLRQSTCGRGSGHGKVSLVILSDPNAKAVEIDNNRYGFPWKNPSQHSKLNNRPSVATRKANSWHIDFRNLPDDDPVAAAILAEIRTELENIVAPVLELGKPPIRRIQLCTKIDTGAHPHIKLHEGQRFFPILQVFTEERMTRLASYFANRTSGSNPLELLRPDDLPLDNPGRLAVWDGYVAISVGNAERGGKSGSAALGGGDHALRNKTSPQSDKKFSNGRRYELLFTYDERMIFTLKTVRAPLRESVTFVDDLGADVDPKQHTWQHKQAEGWARNGAAS